MADKLVQDCISAVRDGVDFPTIWQSILRRDALVMGPPLQASEDGRICLKIPLSSRQWLVFDSASKQFSLTARGSLYGL